MFRIECDCTTGEAKTVELTPEEESAALATQAEWDAANTGLSGPWMRKTGSYSRSTSIRNRASAFWKGKPAITRVQYRDALIAEWKRWNS